MGGNLSTNNNGFRYCPKESIHSIHCWVIEMKKLTMLVTMLIAVSLTASAESLLTPAAISEQVATHGAQQTLRTIYKDTVQWAKLLTNISSGTPEWLGVANQLRQGSDAGASEEIGYAVGEALEHSPVTVLTLSIPIFRLDELCAGPDIDDQRFNSYDLAAATIVRRQQALRSVSAESLVKLRDACVGELEKSKGSIARFFGKER
jgi:hypothetical protein